MLKVSFKEDCQKVQVFNNRATIVTLVGEMRIPGKLWMVFPEEVTDWMWNHQGVDVQWGSPVKNIEGFRLEVTGKSVCAEGDTFNEVTGQRIAESRAKLKLFLFVARLLKKLNTYYSKLMMGYTIIPTYTGPGTLYSDMMKYNACSIKESHHLGKLLKEA